MTDTDTSDDFPDLFDQWQNEYGNDAALIQARALCRMAAIQQAQYEAQKEQREHAQQMFEQFNEDIEDLFDPSADTDDFRFDPDDDDQYW